MSTSSIVSAGEEDLILLRKIAEGDRRSFEFFYDKYAGLIFSTVSRILNDPRDAEDVTQDVFIQIWDKAALYNPARGTPLTWSITLAKNKSIDRLRAVQRKFRLTEAFHEESSIASNSSRSKPSEVQIQEHGRIVRSAVLELLPDQREVIEMAYFSGLTQSQIAEELNQPIGTVKAKIRRAMQNLKEIISRRL